jgi:hypothetical protein
VCLRRWRVVGSGLGSDFSVGHHRSFGFLFLFFFFPHARYHLISIFVMESIHTTSDLHIGLWLYKPLTHVLICICNLDIHANHIYTYEVL